MRTFFTGNPQPACGFGPSRKAPRLAAAAIVLATAGPGVANADAVQDWNAITVAITGTQNPFAAARFAAITQLAVFEAVNAVTGEYEPYLGTLAAPQGASADAAAVAAAHRVLSTYFPASVSTLDAARAASLDAIPDGQAETDGIAVGEAAAAALIANRANDGSTPPQFYLPVTANPGEWLPTPGCPSNGGILLHWRNVRPFGLRSGDQFRSPPPPALTSMRYAKDFNEVKAMGELNSTLRPPDRTDVARYYAATTPVHVFSQVLTQEGRAKSWSLSQNARAFALLTMAISDALVSSHDTKYHYVFWRPITAIHAADTDGNALTERDAAWTPLITTPCFPSYQSAHATGSNAARRIAERLAGGEGSRNIVVSNPAVPGVTFHYTRFSEITDDIDDARVYGGIHFRFDQEAGARLGQSVADYIYKTQLRRHTPIAQGEGAAPADARTSGIGSIATTLAGTSSTGVIVNGTSGQDTLTGTPGDDTINGRGGADRMIGLAGNDTYIVDNDADAVVEQAGEGTDTIRASTVGSWLAANVENLVLTGTRDGFALGNNLANRIAGNSGYNTLDGGLGNDTLRGGPGRDLFRFTTRLNGLTNVDRLTDFDTAEDRIALHWMAFPDFIRSSGGGMLEPWKFHVGASATTTAHRIVYNPTSGDLFYDPDGIGSTAAVRFARLPAGLALTYAHFLVWARYQI